MKDVKEMTVEELYETREEFYEMDSEARMNGLSTSWYKIVIRKIDAEIRLRNKKAGA